MKTPHYAVVSSPEEGIYVLSKLFLQEHIFRSIDTRFLSYYGAHCLFREIEKGEVRVYESRTKEHEFCGVNFGNLDGERFIAHALYLRGTDALKGCQLCEEVMVEDYLSVGLGVKEICGYIPEDNRAALRMAKAFGCIDRGRSENTVIRDNGTAVFCREMVKTL